MNKEEIEEIKSLLFQDRLTQYGKRKLVQYLEQKETILDKVKDYIKTYIDDKQNEYEAISESYVCQTDEDEYLKEKKLAIIKGQKQVLKNVLNIIEGEKE